MTANYAQVQMTTVYLIRLKTFLKRMLLILLAGCSYLLTPGAKLAFGKAQRNENKCYQLDVQAYSY